MAYRQSPLGYYYVAFQGVGDEVSNGFAANVEAFKQSPEAQHNAELLITYLIGRGWSTAAACGAVGHLSGESHYNPSAYGTGGCGFIGWTKPSTLKDYVSYFGVTGAAWYWGEYQAWVMAQEMDNIEPFDGRWILNTNYGYTYSRSEFKSLTDPVEAGTCYFYQRGTGMFPSAPALKSLPTRQALMQYIYDWWIAGHDVADLPPVDEDDPVQYPARPPAPPPSFVFRKPRGRRKKQQIYYPWG